MSNQTYLCIRRSNPEAPKGNPPSPAQMEEMYAKFNEWKENFAENIVDLGGQLGDGCVVTSEGTQDGPFIEAKEVVGGFMIIRAASLDDAINVVRESPGVVGVGASVEVREINTP